MGLTITMMEYLYKFGFTFDINDGKVTGFHCREKDKRKDRQRRSNLQ